jgi:hypothetical protein
MSISFASGWSKTFKFQNATFNQNSKGNKQNWQGRLAFFAVSSFLQPA